MNLRALKKQSKRAVPFLIAHFGRKTSDFFLDEPGNNYHGVNIRCPHKPGRFRCDCHCHPLKGTPMIGEVSGYYEPEWEERTALEELQRAVMWSERPETASDRDWRQMLRITRVRPISEEEFHAWAMESLGIAGGTDATEAQA